MTGNFNIRDRDWDPEYLFHLIHNDLLLDIVDAFDLSFSYSTNPIPTRYLNNNNDLNSVINLMFLRSNSLELDNYLILSDLQYMSDYTSLVVDIYISEEFMQDDKCTIIKNSKDEIKFILISEENIKKINTLHLTNKELLEFTVQEFARISNHMWQKHLKQVKITKQFKDW